MAYTLYCPSCGTALHLFDSAVKKRRGTVRCTLCGARISYDLDNPRTRRKFFPSVEQPHFDKAAREKMVQGIQNRRSLKKENGGSRTVKHKGFAAFDLKTGKILDETGEK